MNQVEQFISGLNDATQAIAQEFLSIWLWIQIGLIVLAVVIAGPVAALVRKRLDLVALTMGWPPILRLLARAIAANLGVIIFLVLTGFLRVALFALTAPERSYLLAVAAKLATAWVVISLVAGLIHNRFIYRLVAVSAWTITALSILGLLDPTVEALNSVAVVFGGLRISALLVLKTVALLMLALWAAVALSDFLDKRVRGVADLTPSLQVLVAKFIRISLLTLAVVIVLSSAGIDFSALAIFSGAVGVGIGLGLQKIVSNFVSGIVLLVDKSIKPGDVIAVGDSYGWVSSMNTRYIAVVQRNGREVLIPNEDLVTQRVVNWSFTKDEVRVDVEFGVDVASDPHLVRRVATEAAASVSRVLKKPEPFCHFTAFSSRSLDFLLRFWIDDPAAGVTNIKGTVLLAMWDAFKREGIQIPSPIQDMRLRGTAHVVTEAQQDPPSARS